MKKVTVTLVRNYFKTAQIEVFVEDDLVGEELQNFLTNDSEVTANAEDELASCSLQIADEEWEFQDPTTGDGGHL